jgi:hypothetical protein
VRGNRELASSRLCLFWDDQASPLFHVIWKNSERAGSRPPYNLALTKWAMSLANLATRTAALLDYAAHGSHDESMQS